MRRYVLFILSLVATAMVSAQTHIRVWQGGEDNRMKVANVGDMTFSGGQMTMKGVRYNLSEIDSIVVVPEITVQYNGSTALVKVPKSIEADVTVDVDGANVTITNTNVSNEVEVVLSGTSSNGSFTYNGAYKCTFYLNGLNLTSTKGAALDIECGKRVAMVLTDGTTNSLTDALGGSQKACLYCKGHLEVEGGGTLNVTANARHGIATKEYLQLKRSTGSINILKAGSDGIHCGQYFQMNGGSLTIDGNTAADGIQAEYLMLDDNETPDPAEENNGQVIIKGGVLNITVSHEDCKAIKADSHVTISGGTFVLNALGNGTRGIQTDGNLSISQTDAATNMTVAVAGGKCTLEECIDDPHKCMGFKADGDFHLYGIGKLDMSVTGKKAKGIKVGGTSYLHGNTSYISLLDCLNIVTD